MNPGHGNYRRLRGPRNTVDRRDSLPEHREYQDTGCEVAPACLRCPLPMCRYDNPSEGGRPPSPERAQRLAAVREMLAANVERYEMAARLGISRRVVQRMIAELRESGDALEVAS